MSGSPYDEDVAAPDAGQLLDAPPPPGSEPAGLAVDQNPTQLGFGQPPSRPPPPPQFIGYGVDGQPLYGYKPGMSPFAKLALAAATAAVAGWAIASANSRPRRRDRDDD